MPLRDLNDAFESAPASPWPQPTPAHLRTWRAAFDCARPLYDAERRKWAWRAAAGWPDANPPAGVLPPDLLAAMARYSRDGECEYETEAGAWATLAVAVHMSESTNGKR